MTRESRASRARSEVTAGVEAAAEPGGDASPTRGGRKPLRDRVRESADKLGLGPLPERPSTKALLMDVGEVIIGRHGVEGVTLREIGLLAGQSNSNVVQYHFENKEGLISAILEDRVKRRETMRAEQLEGLKAQGLHDDPRRLLEILWLPSLSFRDKHGNHAFCRFMLQCRLHPECAARHPHDERFEGSVLIEIMQLFRKNFPHLPKEVFSQRFSALTLMFVSSVVEFDNFRQANGQGARGRGEDFDPRQIVDMAIAAFSAPYGK
jgi:AcrR family transcriptional regulator